MKPGAGSRKGSSYERKIAKDLSLWWSDGKRNDLFWRTHSSGQLGTRSKKMTEYGDLMSIHDNGKEFTEKFHIECRHGKCIKIHDLVYAPKASSSNMTGFIQEGFTGAKASLRTPLWIFREQGQEIMVMMTYTDYCFYIPQIVAIKNDATVALFPLYELVLMTYDNFKKCFKRETLCTK